MQFGVRRQGCVRSPRVSKGWIALPHGRGSYTHFAIFNFQSNLPFLIPSSPAQALRCRNRVEVSEMAERDSVRQFEILPGASTETISTPHRAESLAIRLTDSTGASVVYTSDTGYSESLAKFARDADLLILECSFYRNKPTAK